MSTHRRATSADYPLILKLLNENVKEGVLVGYSIQSNKSPYPLLNISEGPFRISEDGIEVFSLKPRIRYTVRIRTDVLGSLEMRRGDEKWESPEVGPLFLLVPN